ncbi:prephenate dehydratase [Pontibacter sp. 172403-2]|uniref:prephenate dehydratase n=1 Tax=Pontibacter rufus TaxID=2791028 RepID=UPI0018AF9B27|nr:prephenate dehydratase domain-containing protein [Pontibacter sp. 172403-2]MBF9255334.1 prephenate dehydratase [Pontibacter sp. 172403-2]
MATKINIAIQGGPASFHDMAARQLFAAHNAADILPCATFQQLCDALQSGQADFAVMAIENAVAGSIHTNYTLLQQHDFSILEELWLPVDQNLMALPGQRLQDITMVCSHPVALLQCVTFLQQYPHMQLQQMTDTADSARLIKEKQQYGVAAIASHMAAQLYGMEILRENIADQKGNYTRFLLLSRHKPADDEIAEANKATLLLDLPLADITLKAVKDKLHMHDMHISLVEPFPPAPLSVGGAHVAIDVEGAGSQELLDAIDELRPLVRQLQVLGLYRRARNPLQPAPKQHALADVKK